MEKLDTKLLKSRNDNKSNEYTKHAGKSEHVTTNSVVSRYC